MLLSTDGPANGYQLMQGLEERSDGRWRPSPGSVYPALQQLEDEGLIHSVQTEGESGRAFELTDAGRAHLAERGEQKAPWEPGEDEEGNQHPEVSVFATDREGSVRHVYTTSPTLGADAHERGIDLLCPTWELLDLTPAGRGACIPARTRA